MSGSNGWLSLDACTSCSLNYFLPYNLFLYYGGYAAFLITFLYCLESASVFARTARLMVRPCQMVFPNPAAISGVEVVRP
jgi:hypothetical protein